MINQPTDASAGASRFDEAIRRFDEENACDPNVELVDGKSMPCELVYARRLSEWVAQLAPNASEPLRLAARCQHICRWTIPRDRYPITRPGYLKWRSDLKSFHAQKAGEILAELGYPPETVARVQSLNLKKSLATDPECQVLEDALCLVFLQHQLTALAAKTAEEKVINALRKSWQKMSPTGREHALRLPFSEHEKKLIEAALTKPRAPGTEASG